MLERWLADGTGGTRWPSSNALYAVLRTAGFDARRVIASMRDVGVLNHASVKVSIEGRDWLVDSSMLLNAPLPMVKRYVWASGPDELRIRGYSRAVDGGQDAITHRTTMA